MTREEMIDEAVLSHINRSMAGWWATKFADGKCRATFRGICKAFTRIAAREANT